MSTSSAAAFTDSSGLHLILPSSEFSTFLNNAMRAASGTIRTVAARSTGARVPKGLQNDHIVEIQLTGMWLALFESKSTAGLQPAGTPQFGTIPMGELYKYFQVTNGDNNIHPITPQLNKFKEWVTAGVLGDIDIQAGDCSWQDAYDPKRHQSRMDKQQTEYVAAVAKVKAWKRKSKEKKEEDQKAGRKAPTLPHKPYTVDDFNALFTYMAAMGPKLARFVEQLEAIPFVDSKETKELWRRLVSSVRVWIMDPKPFKNWDALRTVVNSARNEVAAHQMWVTVNELLRQYERAGAQGRSRSISDPAIGAQPSTRSRSGSH